MAPSSDERLAGFEEARKELGGSSALGSERYAIPKSWYETFKKSKATSGPKHVTANEKNVLWLPLPAVQLLEQWYGESYAPLSSGWLKGVVIFSNNEGEEEVESAPTFASVEIRVDEKEKAPLSKLENVSASEEIPQLVRKALDSVPSLSNIDEEDVRLWIRKSGEAEFHLCSSDEAKAAMASEPEEDLPEEFEEATESGTLKVVPTLRSVLGPSQAGQTLHLLLELRDSDGKFPRKDGTLVLSVITPRKGKDAPQSDAFNDKSRPVSQSFSVNADPCVGQTCDVQRTSDDRWLEAKIVKVQGDQITVHYLSFPSEADEVFPCKSPRIQSPHSRVSAWREQLRVGEEIDVHTYAFQLRRGGRLYKLFWEKSGKTAWVAGTVRKVERSLPEPRVNVGVRFRYGAAESTAWVPLNSEKIAKRYTHLARPKADGLGPQSSQGAPPSRGVVGLRNLGNTCYMNSMLQCLSHCEPLREFFISGDYANDLNFKNPLGTGGELAKAFAEVLTEIWSGEYQVVAPKRFKQVLAQVNVQFQGYQQHDSQELLTMLTDSLHEDLNRIKNKPATGPVESGGRPDEVVAKESWETFRKRNDSKVVDEMYGLMKSHLVCNVCRKEAIKFDPYSNVSVPVPSMVMSKIQVIFVNKQKQAIRCVASVPKRSTGRTLAEWLCAHFAIRDQEDLVIAEVYLNSTAFFFHRAAIAGGVPSTEGGGEGFERKNVKDIREGTTILAWQLPSKEELTSKAKCPPASQALFDSRWKSFFKEINMLIEASTSPADEAMVAKCKDLFLAKYMIELCGPYPVAQKKLAEGLANITSMEAAQVMAREAIRLAESQVGFQCPIDPDLAQEADDGQSSVTGSGEQTAGNSSDSGSTSSKPILTKKSTASQFRKFLPRLIGGNPSIKDDVNNGSTNGSSQLVAPPRTNTPPMNGNGSTQSSPAQASAASAQQHLAFDPSARIAIEVRHHRPGRIRKYRMPMFFAALPNQTLDALRADIDGYIARHVLDGFSPDTGDQNLIPSAAAGAAQLELTSNHPHYAADIRKNQAQSIPLTSFYSIELDSASGGKLPHGPIPLSESLLRRFPVNAVVLYVIWKEGPAAEHAFQSVNQAEDNPEAMGDTDLGLGKIQVDATCLQKEEKDGEVERFITLEQCMDVFRQREQLGEDDPWYCDQCKTHQCVFKKMDLWDAPRVLVIHLKRFLYERVGGVLGERVQREKITDLVKFPIEGFDIGQMLAGKNQGRTSTVYDLFAVSNHMGGLGGGHYTAYVKTTDGVWWLMNDGVATKVEKQDEESQIVSSNAYVLFYKRRE